MTQRPNFFVRGEDDILNSISLRTPPFKEIVLQLDSGAGPISFFYQRVGSTVECYITGDTTPSSPTTVVSSTTPIPLEARPSFAINTPISFLNNISSMRIGTDGIITYFDLFGQLFSPVLKYFV